MLYKKKNEIQHNTDKRTRQGQGRNSKPNHNRKQKRGQGK